MDNLMGAGSKKTPEELAREQEISKRFAQLSERTRLLEERFQQMHQKIQVIDETNIKKIKDMKEKISSVEEQLISFRKDYDELKEIVRKVAKDVGQSAKLSDIRVLEKYINLVDFTRIVTKEDVYGIIKEYESEKKKRKIEV